MTQVPPRDAIVLRWFFLIALVSAIVFACVGSVLAIAQGWFESEKTLVLVVYTPLIILLCGAVGLSGTLVLQGGRLVNYMRIMIFLLLVTCTFSLIFLLNPEMQKSSNAGLYYVLCSNLTLIIFSMLMIAQILILNTKSVVLRYITMLLIISQCAAVVIVLIFSWTDLLNPYGDLVPGLLTLWIVLNLFVMLLLPPITRSIEDPKIRQTETFESKTSLNLNCPKCGKQQCLPTGLVRCTKCKFKMIIELEEPRCECGYQLYNLQSNKCPECGKEIPESDRWASQLQSTS